MAYNFPDSPTYNEVFGVYKWDGEKWILAAGGVGDDSLIPFKWNSADISSGMTLAQSDITVEHMSGTTEGVRANKVITGKKVFAVHFDSWSGSGTRIGVTRAALDLAATNLGTTTDSVVFNTPLGTVLYNGSPVATYTAVGAAYLVLVAFDDSGGSGAIKIWFGHMAYGGSPTWNGNPSAGTSAAKSDLTTGPWFPVVGNVNVGPTERVTLVPVPVGAIPSGFTAMDPNVSPIWVGSMWQPLTGAGGPLGAAFNLRQEIPASWIFRGGTQVRLTYQAATGGMTVNHATIAQKAASGDAWDWQPGTDAQVTFSSAASSGAIASLTRMTSDVITYTLDETKAHICGIMHLSTTDNMASTSNPNGFANHILFSSTDALNTADVSGYSTFANAVRSLVGIEVPYV